MRVCSSETTRLNRLSAWVLGLVLVISTTSCSLITGGDDEVHTTISQRVLQPDRRYAVAIPKSYSGEEAVPLVLALHYGGAVTPYIGMQAMIGLFEPGLRKLGAIIVAPDVTGAGWTSHQSVSDALAILAEVQEEFNIDPHRILVTGFSMGGAGTWYFAANHPDRFTAAITIAGYPPDGVLDGPWTVPIYAIHSSDDDEVPLAPTTAAIEQLQGRGVVAELVIVNDREHYDVEKYVGPLKNAVPWLEQIW